MGLRRISSLTVVKSINKSTEKYERDLTYHRRSYLWRNFGFIPNPNISIHANTVNRLLQTPLEEIFTQPRNKSFHNLCKGSRQPPHGVGKLLGLGLNYCIETPFPYQGQPIEDTARRLHRATRLGVEFDAFNVDIEDSEEDDDEYYDPNLYVPKTDWIPECEDEEIEGAYFKFQETLQEIHQALPYTKHFNLTKQQRSVLTELKERDDLVIFPTDKNLGPYIISREDYIKQCLNEYLLKGDYYLMLSDADAEELLEKKATHSTASITNTNTIFQAHTSSTSIDRSTY